MKIKLTKGKELHLQSWIEGKRDRDLYGKSFRVEKCCIAFLPSQCAYGYRYWIFTKFFSVTWGWYIQRPIRKRDRR